MPSWDELEPKKPQGRLGKPVKGLGARHEDRTIKKLSRFGARKQPGSGNQPGKKGDFEIPKAESLLGECKATDKKVLEVQMAWLCRITRQARDKRKKPIVVLAFEGMPTAFEREWGAVPLSVLEALIEAAGWELETKDG